MLDEPTSPSSALTLTVGKAQAKFWAWVVFCVLLSIGGVSTWFSWRYVVQWENEQTEAAVDRRMQQLMAQVDERLKLYALVVRMGAGLHREQERMSEEDWRRFATHLNLRAELPGICALAWIPLHENERLGAIVGARYIAPESSANRTWLDANFFSDVARSDVVQAAIAGIDTPYLSAQTRLYPGTADTTMGALWVMPTYRELQTSADASQQRSRLLGAIVAAIRFDDLFDATTHLLGAGFDLDVFDNSWDEESRVFSTRTKITPPSASLLRTYAINAGQRTWRLRVSSRDDGPSPYNRTRSGLTLALGVLLTLVTLGLAAALLRWRQATDQRVRLMRGKLGEREARLAGYREFLRNVLDALPEPIVVKGADYRYLMVNRAYADAVGRTMDELIGKRVEDVLPHEIAAPLHEIDKRVLEHRHREAMELPVRDLRHGGQWRYVAIQKVFSYGPNGESMLVGIQHDITEMRQSEARFRELVELSSDWYWEQDAEFRFTYVSMGIDSAGIAAGSLIGLHRWDMPIQWMPGQLETHKAVLAAHRPFADFEYRIVDAHGGEHWYSISGRPQFDAKAVFTGYRGVGKDITERQRAREELLRHRDHLSEMVEEQIVHLRIAKDAAEAAAKAKSEFVANMSHELRTPLHAILSFTKLGLTRVDSAAPDKARSYFQRAHQAGERLLVLVNNLLDVAKIDAGKLMLDRHTYDLAQLARDVVIELEPLIQARQLRVSAPPEGVAALADVDFNRMSQVVSNLLSNAIKFTAPGRAIFVAIEESAIAWRRQPGALLQPIAAWSVSVSDEGVGIPANELDAVFEKFIQSSTTRTGAGGTGLGLAISRDIVEAHGGTLRAYNRPEGGACFEILIPK